MLNYRSTRGGDAGVSASEAIVKGLAKDGGLFVPEVMPQMDQPLEALMNLSYQGLAYEVMSKFYEDFTEEELKACINQAYDSKFDTDLIAPTVKVGDDYFLELFHGSTIAFKDMALSILPYLMKTAAKKIGITKEIIILTATSGDTGKAALAGFADVEGIGIVVFYPKDGVSPIQKQQMVTQKGANTQVIGIDGNFDDAQNGVKSIFTDLAIKEQLAQKGFQLSSANSINIGRLIPQVVYYFYTYLSLMKQGEIAAGEAINVSVPTGNFGNILAAYYAKAMGLPIKKLICASNDNKVLYDFLKTGTYNKDRDFVLTSSPSMDILISSNLERLIDTIADQQGVQTKTMMESLVRDGQYEITGTMTKKLEDFYGNFAKEEETAAAIKEVFEKNAYLMDPHTAVGYDVLKKYREATGDKTKTVVVSTASPYKFTRSTMTALDPAYGDEKDFDLVQDMFKVSKVTIPKAIDEALNAEVRHKVTCSKAEMLDEIMKFLDTLA